MATYLILNLAVMAVIVVVLIALGLRVDKKIALVMGLLLMMTAIFDSLIVQAGIVAYDHSRILGLYVGAAPLEDFFYAVAVGMIVPTLWRKLERNDDPHGKNKTTN